MHILCVLALFYAVASAGHVNVTLDDTSPVVVYTQPPLMRCLPGVDECDPDKTARLFNGTSATTFAPVFVPFVGTAVYVYLGAEGWCLFRLDNVESGQYFGADANDVVLAFKNESLTDGPHILLIYPATEYGQCSIFRPALTMPQLRDIWGPFCLSEDKPTTTRPIGVQAPINDNIDLKKDIKFIEKEPWFD
ncbi:hypothetical protein GGX14DRAFT_676388 [Mycena pura]|uniref:Uncharacterized protein n=1 Tax=Mycena pura TaxID=153505 RepID=A0AAD6YHX2_9AGAR|nr:hypothetical protein GGX14DRAFT_676388 [Mycena pura]